MLPSLPIDVEPREISAALPQPTPLNDFGGVLSPSQVRTFRDCGAKWYYKYALSLPDPPNGSLVRGRVVHQMAETFFRAKLDGGSPDPDDLQACFEDSWDREAAAAAFGADEDVDLLKRQAAMLTRKYLDEVAPEIEPAALEFSVQGVIGGVPVRGFVDLLDTSGRVIDLKTATRKPTGVSADYAFQLATYRQLCPGANGTARVDTLVATKSPQVVTQEYTVSPADLRMTEKLYPLVREAMREGLYLPNRSSNLCSYKHCAFAAVCESEFGGRVRGRGPVASSIGRNIFYYELDVEAYLQEERNKAYANKKTRTVVALPVHNLGSRVRRFDRTTGHRSQPESRRALREGPTGAGETGPQG